MDFSKVGLGGSCHWCTEAIFQSLLGVTKVEQGWISSEEYSTYSEAVIVHFDSTSISISDIIKIHLHTHSCTSMHSMREKYRSAVYVHSSSQRDEAFLALDSAQDDFDELIITQVLAFDKFKINKEEYLNYYYSNPDKAFCKNQITPKLNKLMAMFTKRVDLRKLQL